MNTDCDSIKVPLKSSLNDLFLKFSLTFILVHVEQKEQILSSNLILPRHVLEKTKIKIKLNNPKYKRFCSKNSTSRLIKISTVFFYL